MLKRLTAHDFAIIESAELEPGLGLIALTGETGAGKSLMVDALMLLAGARADSGMIRHGAARAQVEAEFELTGRDDLRARLAELEIDDEDRCCLRRVLKADGTSRAFINDRAVTLASLREIAAELYEVHGQHEHQALNDRARQLQILDEHARIAALPALAELSARWRQTAQALAELEARAGRGGEALDFLSFKLDELSRLNLAPAAIAELDERHQRLANHGELVAITSRAVEQIDGDHDHAVRGVLARTRAELARAAAIDPGLSNVLRAFDEAEASLGEAADALARYADAGELDPAQLTEVERTLARLHELARKHRVTVNELAQRQSELAAEVDAISNAEGRRIALGKTLDESRAAWHTLAAKVSVERGRAASELGAAVGALMDELGMAGGRFQIALEQLPDKDPAALGFDRAEFMVSANPGQALRPLRKVASGGELSRIALALEVATLKRSDTRTMVFDEVDSGIGGAVAEVLGRKLRELGGERQVLCVTHLAQVAAQAHAHFAIEKRVVAGNTRTELRALDANARRGEIARMLGGIEITAQTLALAGDMLERAG